MSDAVQEHNAKFSIGCRNIKNMCFSDDIDAVAHAAGGRSPSRNFVQNLQKV